MARGRVGAPVCLEEGGRGGSCRPSGQAERLITQLWQLPMLCSHKLSREFGVSSTCSTFMFTACPALLLARLTRLPASSEC